MYFEEVKYYLTTPLIGRTLLGTPPIGWNDDNKELVRSQSNWGVFTQLSNSLEFVNDAQEILTATYEALGTEADVILERYIITQLNGLELDYIGHLDMKTYTYENDRVKVEFLTGGLQSLIESQFDEEFEIERLTDINGNEIDALQFKKMLWDGRKILLQGLLENSQEESYQMLVNDFFGSGGDYVGYLNFRPTFINGYENNVLIPSSTNSFTLIQPNPNPLEQPSISNFVFLASRDRTITIDFDWQFTVQDFNSSGIGEMASLFVLCSVFNTDANSNPIVGATEVVSQEVFQFFGGGSGGSSPASIIGDTFSGSNTITLNLEQGQVVFLGMGGQAAGVSGQGSGGTGFMQWVLSDVFGKITITENSVFPFTSFNCIRVHDLGNRLMQIITGKKNLFKSQFFGQINDGYFENSLFEKLVISSGEKIRNIPESKITISLKDIYELNNYFNLGWAVQKIGAIEKLVIEKKEYFFQQKFGIELGEVSEFKISVADDLLFKSLTFGNDKAGDYEEVQGRSEYNVLNSFVTPLKTADTEYNVEGKVRADLIGAELARRKQYNENPSEDTRYDKENFLFMVSTTLADNLQVRPWQSDFETEPIVYDPDSAGNLLLTPFRSMQRHASFFKCGMIPYNTDSIRYSSTTGNSNAGTQLPDEPVRFENGSIQLNELQPPIFKAEYYEFKFPTTHEIRKKLMEKIDGIPIPYFLVTFTFREQTYSGWLISVSLNNEGNWKLIKNYK